MSRIPFTFAATVVAATVLAAGAAQADKQYYKLGSFPPGTSPYIVNTAFATAVNKYVPDAEIQISATGAATLHQLLVTEGKMDFAMGAATGAQLMYRQQGPFKKVTDGPARIAKMPMLFSYPIGAYHFVTYANSDITRLSDLKGKKVFLGPPGGVATRNVILIVEAMTGLQPEKDFTQVKMGWGAAAQAFQDRKFDVWVPVTNAPSPQIQQIALSNKIRILGLDKEKFDRPAWKKYWSQPGRSLVTIEPGVYGENQVNTEPALTTGAFVGMIARHDIPEETIYRMVKAFWDHIDETHAMAKWAKKSITPEIGVSAIAGKLHPGAAKYYAEKGLKVTTIYDPASGIGD